MTLKWLIEFYKDAQDCIPVNEWLKTLEPRAKAKVFRRIELLKQFGTQLGEPYCKHLRGKIWELRTSFGRLEYRVLYFATGGRIFVLLHAFTKKTRKTDPHHIGIAEQRAEDYEANR